ncbi:MAG: trypsin-like peptidase domain-containing protein [Patescibacteria group bacterium]
MKINIRNVFRVAGALIVGLVLGAAFYPGLASAGFLGDLWNSFVAPFTTPAEPPAMNGVPPASTSTAPSLSPTPPVVLYKPAIDYERAVVAAVKKASPAVVSIIVSKDVPIVENCPIDPFADLPPEFRQFFGGDAPQLYGECERGTKLQEVGGGSGFIISADGLILTNKHVVLDAQASYTVFTNDGKKYTAQVLARDPLQDLAVVKIAASGLATVELGDSNALELGQTAISIGNALGEFRNTVAVGVISGLSRTVNASGGSFSETIRGVIQTDAAINPGNSGGPLLNLQGQVVGINTAIVSGAQNIGFAIPINDAKRAITSVKKSGEIQTPFLGVRYRILNQELAKKLNLAVDYGALLEYGEKEPAITPDSPAARAGLQVGDVILEIDGKKVDEDNPLGAIISRQEVGDTVALKVWRNNNTFILKATLAKRPVD